MTPALPYFSTHIPLAESSDHPGHTLSQVLTLSFCRAGGKGREASLAHPKASHSAASWDPRSGLLGKCALFGNDIQPWAKPLPSRQVVLWGQDTCLDCIPYAWSGLLMALEAKECGLQNQVA